MLGVRREGVTEAAGPSGGAASHQCSSVQTPLVPGSIIPGKSARR
jgi:hypothetical protein